jgi:hypothetical protein
MGGGQIQIAAKGAQDVYLMGNPQITYFKMVYRRHTNFAIESIEQTLTSGTFDFDSEVNYKIARNGDLIYRMYMTCELPALGSSLCDLADTTDPVKLDWTDSIGYILIKDISIYIGGKLIDKHYGEWLDIWAELSEITTDKLWTSILKKTDPTNIASYSSGNTNRKELYIPFNFWFNNNPGRALPLVALQYHDIEVKITTRALNELIISNKNRSSETGSISNHKFYIDYIFLDENERRRFVNSEHEYLIEQLQIITKTLSNGSNKVDLHLNHPVKELIFTVINSTRASQSSDANEPSDTTDSPNSWALWGSYSTTNPLQLTTQYDFFENLDILFNGNSRVSNRGPQYYRMVQPIQHHSRLPDNYIYVYSFALKPEDVQPSGTCNFSKLGSAQLKFSGVPSQTSGELEIKVYAINYNILKITNGMGGIIYTN